MCEASRWPFYAVLFSCSMIYWKAIFVLWISVHPEEEILSRYIIYNIGLFYQPMANYNDPRSPWNWVYFGMMFIIRRYPNIVIKMSVLFHFKERETSKGTCGSGLLPLSLIWPMKRRMAGDCSGIRDGIISPMDLRHVELLVSLSQTLLFHKFWLI